MGLQYNSGPVWWRQTNHGHFAGETEHEQDISKNVYQGGRAAAFVARVPMVIADDKPAAKNPIVGDGEFKYECIHGWAKVPEGMRFGNTHMVQEDAQGRMFIHHTGAPDSVFIFDPDGKFIKSWGKEWCPGAHGMQMRKEGTEEFLYLDTTGQARVVKTTLDGDVLFNLG